MTANPADPAADLCPVQPVGERPAERSDEQPLGDRYDPFGTHLADPYPFYAHAREHEPVFYAPALHAWVLTRYDDVRYALAHPELFSSANSLRPLTLLHPATLAVLQTGYPRTPEPISSDGAAHRRLRAPIAKALSRARVTTTEPFIRQIATELVDTLADSGSNAAELMGAYAYPLPVAVICHLFGIDPAHHAQVAAGSYDSVRVIASQRPEPDQASAAQGMLDLQRLCGAYAHQRHTTPGDDLISIVVAALTGGDHASTGPLTDAEEAELAQVLHGVIIAGHVTTSALIGNGIRHLLTNRDRWTALCERPDLIPTAVEELLRFDTSVQGFLRVTTRPVTIAGVELPAGAEVFVCYGAANRDPAQFPDPDVFDITRPLPPGHLSFATGGVHHCVGAPLARAEVTITLELLTRRLPGLRLADQHQKVEIEPTMTTRGPIALHVTW